MKPDKGPRPDQTNLRRRAEARLGKKKAQASPAAGVDDPQRLVHELQVHQIELEMQNEELRQARRDLEASLARYTDLYEFAPVGYFSLDDQGTILEVNLIGAALLGTVRSRVRGRTFASFLAYESLGEVNQFMEQVRANQTRQSCQVTMANQRAPARHLHIEGAPAEWSESDASKADEGHVRLAVLDITKQKEAESKQKMLEVQLRQAQKLEAIGILAGGIAHEFNNILAAIMGFAEMALEAAQIGKSDPQDMERVISSAVRARDLVRRIMTFSRTSTLASKPLCINQSVDQIAKMLLRIMPKNITIQSNLAPDLAFIDGDPGQIEQILMNLTTNAKDTMPEGGRLSIETINVFLDEGFCRQHLGMVPGHYVLLKVADTGQGMDESSLEHIYDPFFTTKEVGKGTGLGLSIVHGIVKSHGGHIFCQSKPGEGTSFDIYFPAAPNLAPASALQVEPIQEATLDSQFILLVDDEEALRDLGIRILERAGHKVFTAQSGEDALELYITRGHQMDLVIMDLGMSGMGGLKALKAILGINPQAKVLVASGYAAEDQVKDALAAGAVGYVAKPFSKAELLANIKLVLAKS